MAQENTVNEFKMDDRTLKEYHRRRNRAYLEKKGIKPRVKLPADKYDEVCQKYYIDNVGMKTLIRDYHVGYTKLKEILDAGKDKYIISPVEG